ncbi:hypothetical protein D3C72_2032840 [compost metagenome]
MRLGIGEDELRRHLLRCGARLRGGEHGGGDVDARRMAGRPGHGHGGAAGAASHVKHGVRLKLGGGLGQQVFERLEQLVEDRLGIDPGIAGRAVPQRGLGVIGRAGGIHAGLLAGLACLRGAKPAICQFKPT